MLHNSCLESVACSTTDNGREGSDSVLALFGGTNLESPGNEQGGNKVFCEIHLFV